MRRLFSRLGVRLVAASGVLALVIGATFALLLVAMGDVRKTSRLADHSRETLTASDGVELLVFNLENGARAFVLTGQERSLEPWKLALTQFPDKARALEGLAVGASQEARADRIVADVRDYVRDYSIPLVSAVRRGDPAASSLGVTAAGQRRVAAIRGRIDAFDAAERARLVERQDHADADARAAVVLGIVGLVGSFAMIAAFATYLARRVARPVRHRAAMASRVARGDFSVRLPETGVGEVGELERSFNAMARSLERSRDDLDRLLLEQGALRRVATLVAEGAEPVRIFATVTREIGELSGADLAWMERYESEAEVTALAGWSRDPAAAMTTGRRFKLDGPSMAASVLEAGAPARIDSFVGDGEIAAEARALGIRSSVGCPVLVEGRLWGVIAAFSMREGAFPAETESQIGEFTALVATAIANADSRDELIASRARIVAAADEARRRIRRDLHDGGQQRLVHALITLKLARRSLAGGDQDAEMLIDEAVEHTEAAVEALRELSHGILPSILTRGGLRAGVGAVVARMPLPVEVDVTAERFPPGVEATAYFVVSEALTNTVKHSGASRARVAARASEGVLRVEISDDGRGGAAPGGGTGLVGLRDRVAALDGYLEIESPPGGGTRILMRLAVPEGR